MITCDVPDPLQSAHRYTRFNHLDIPDLKDTSTGRVCGRTLTVIWIALSALDKRPRPGIGKQT